MGRSIYVAIYYRNTNAAYCFSATPFYLHGHDRSYKPAERRCLRCLHSAQQRDAVTSVTYERPTPYIRQEPRLPKQALFESVEVFNGHTTSRDVPDMIDVSVRLRRAIILNDLYLVRRITKNNPNLLQNPDFAEKGNTSLHLAAKLGFLEIATYLVEAGHENGGISRNADWDTPLIFACEAHPHVAAMLSKKFPESVNWRNKRGVNAIMTAAKHGQDTIVATLLSGSTSDQPSNSSTDDGIEKADIAAQDNDGNTALHYASAYGELKVIRTLLQAGASPLARNAYSWTPISYSLSVAAEVYFRNLVAEFEKRKVEVKQAERAERAKRGVGGVRLVTDDMDPAKPPTEGEPSALTPADDRSPMSGGRFFPQLQGHGSPGPAPPAASTKSESGWSFGGLRGRASSGD